MSQKFLSNIELNAGLVDGNDAAGTSGQILSSTGTGVEWIDQAAISGTGSNKTYYEVKNSSGATILKGKGVMAVGTDGNSGHILIDEMVADGTVEPRYFIGVLETSLANGEIGNVIAFGELDQFNTNGQNGETWTNGQILWCDPDSAGDFTTTQPTAPSVKIPAAFILKASTQGKIQIRVQANEGLHELHDTHITTQSDGEILVWDNTNEYWFNDGTLTVDYTNGNVGIGTTNPESFHKLEVNGFIGSKSSNPQLRMLSTANQSGYLVFGDAEDNDVGYIRYDHSANSMDFIVNTEERVTIDNQGKVGIGTTSPSAKLQIGNGTSNTSNRSSVAIFSGSNTGGLVDGLSLVNSANATFGNGVALNFHNANNYSPTGAIRTYQVPTGVITDSYMSFYTYKSGLNERMRIDALGNVGIGTTSPSVKLEVSASSVAAQFKSTSNSVPVSIYNTGTSVSTIGFKGSTSTNDYNVRCGADVNDFVAYTNNTERMRIDSSGRVGIGGPPTSTVRLSTRGLTNTSADFAFEAANSSGNSLFLVRSDGNVGIGTTSPSEKLTVNGNIESLNTYILKNSSTGKKWQQLRDGADGWNLRHYNGSNWSSNFITVNTSGNVGIGTTSPSEKLDVAGTVKAESLLINSGGNGEDLLKKFVWAHANSSSDGTTWRKVCDVDIPTGIYAALSMDIVYYYPSSNYGASAALKKWIYSAAFRRSDGVQDNLDNAVLYGGNANKVRIVKTATGAYELQARVNASNQRCIVEYSMTSNTASWVTPTSGIVSGSTTGTIYTASENDSLEINTGGRISANSGIFTSDLGIGIDPITKLNIYEDSSSVYPLLRIENDGTGDAALNFVATGVAGWSMGLDNSDGDNFKISTDSGSVSAATKFVIDRSGNVGIGTTSPTSKLSVASPSDTNIVYSGHYSSSNQNNFLEIGILANDGYLKLKNSGVSTTVHLNSDGISYLNGGNVGIGTTTPSYKLQVMGNARVSTQLVVNDYASLQSGILDNGNKRILIPEGATYTTQNSSVTGAIKISLPLNRFKSNSMVTFKVVIYEYVTGKTHEYRIGGYNYSDAGANWYNQSAINLTDDGDNYTVRFGNDGTRQCVWIGEVTDNWTYPQIHITDVTIGYAGNSVDWHNDWQISFVTSFDTVSKSRTPARIGRNMLIDSLVSTGNVGIGTTSPSQKLDVVGNAEINGLLYVNKSIENTRFNSTDANGPFVSFRNNGTAKGYIGSGYHLWSSPNNISNNFGIRAENQLDFGIGASVKMIVNSSGNVGIGTTSPSAKLEVVGEAWVGNGTDGIKLSYSAGNSTGIVDTEYTSTGLEFRVGGSEKMRINSSGNVGIGTASPQAKLHVADGELLISSDIATGGEGKARLRFSEVTGTASSGFYMEYDGDFQSGDNNKLSFFDGTGDHVMTMNNAGNVGIGTITPTRKLSVAGSIEAGGKTTYTKEYSSLSTTGSAVAGLTNGSNGSSACFIFTCFGGGGYQRVIYSCANVNGVWNISKDIDEGVNIFDVSATTGTAITFTFKARTSAQSYSPTVTVEHHGSNLNTTYL